MIEDEERDISDFDDGTPSVTLPGIDATVELIRLLQVAILKHPVASKAAFGALMAEGRAFADTPDGARWREIVEDSELLRRARLLLDLPGLSTLEENDGSELPSTFLDTIFMMSSNSENDEFIETLFKWDGQDGRG